MTNPVTENAEHRLKRLEMRSMRRGIKEMDLILSAYAKAQLVNMDDARLAQYDAFLNENDHDLYQWVTGQVSAPDRFQDLVGDISQALQK